MRMLSALRAKLHALIDEKVALPLPLTFQERIEIMAQELVPRIRHAAQAGYVVVVTGVPGTGKALLSELALGEGTVVNVAELWLKSESPSKVPVSAIDLRSHSKGLVLAGAGFLEPGDDFHNLLNKAKAFCIPIILTLPPYDDPELLAGRRDLIQVSLDAIHQQLIAQRGL